MKKFVLVLFFISITATAVKAGDIKASDETFTGLCNEISISLKPVQCRQIIDKEIKQQKVIDDFYGKCEDLIPPVKEAEVPLGHFFADEKNAGRVSWCFTDKIKQHSNPEQFELYVKSKDLMEKFIDDMLYYKGFLTYPENAQLKYKFQSFVYFRLTGDKQYDVPETHKIDCSLNDKITEAPTCLEQDILKICNIHTRRGVISILRLTSEATIELFKSISTDENTIKQWMKEYYNLIYGFVISIRESDLMNPINSDLFLHDVYIYEEMNGLEHLEANELKEPYPLPFP